MAFVVDCCTAVMAILLATVLRVILTRLNARLDRGEHVEGAIGGSVEGEGAAMKKGFRFLT